jgi:hypothetical protein
MKHSILTYKTISEAAKQSSSPVERDLGYFMSQLIQHVEQLEQTSIPQTTKQYHQKSPITERMRKSADAVYLVTDAQVADDISNQLVTAANRIDELESTMKSLLDPLANSNKPSNDTIHAALAVWFNTEVRT